jgi:hypothetical protein
MFASKLNALLEVASGHFRAGCVDDAIEFLEAAVELCEENPAFALKPIESLGTNLQKVVAACVANALSKRVSHARLTELLRRIEALHRAMIH